MARDYMLSVRRAILGTMKANAVLADLVPPMSIYPSTVPADRTFPFIRYGSTISTPFRASGLDSSALRVSIQAFTKGVIDGVKLTMTAEDHAYRIASVIKDILDGVTIELKPGVHARITWVQSMPMRDGDEADAWMLTVTFQAEVAG